MEECGGFFGGYFEGFFVGEESRDYLGAFEFGGVDWVLGGGGEEGFVGFGGDCWEFYGWGDARYILYNTCKVIILYFKWR